MLHDDLPHADEVASGRVATCTVRLLSEWGGAMRLWVGNNGNDATGCDVRPSARTVTETAHGLRELLQQETTERVALVRQAVRLEQQLRALRRSVAT